MVQVPRTEGTLPGDQAWAEFGAGRVHARARLPRHRHSSPAAPCARSWKPPGVTDVLAKAIGTNNPHNVLRATMAGLAALRRRGRRERNPRHETGSPQEVSAMSEITIKLAKSRIGCTPNQKKTLDALGLRRREMVKTFPDNPAVRGMIAKASHLVVEVTKA